ncbi:hypothetical protein E8E11_007681 [Didymella keratinophila]|nr:hypothetical protein E8E11_007681 [Didymella keratinophila]
MPKPACRTLYQFGIDASNPSSKIVTPTAIATSEDVEVIWSSWCDLIYATRVACQAPSIVYSGTSLSPRQSQEFGWRQSKINRTLEHSSWRLSIFGSSMHDGVRGYICRDGLRTLYPPNEQERPEWRDVITGTWDRLAVPVGEIQMCSDNSLLVGLPPSASDTTKLGTQGSIVTMPHPKNLGSRPVTTETWESVANFAPTQLVVNATTATALSPSGQVYTRTTDPRYPSTLGRPYTGSSKFEPVPYLSETRIKKIASGGYMTAAISEDGELFLWGQSNPGTGEELGVLHRLDYDDAAMSKKTVIYGDTIQDDDVKVLNISIEGGGYYASSGGCYAYDVAIGSGHILVAAERETGELVVFAAGCGAEGQLGTGRAVDYEKEFVEVVALRGKRIKQLAAAGWSSFVVAEA